jgi:hypothetical protein
MAGIKGQSTRGRQRKLDHGGCLLRHANKGDRIVGKGMAALTPMLQALRAPVLTQQHLEYRSVDRDHTRLHQRSELVAASPERFATFPRTLHQFRLTAAHLEKRK